MADTVAMPAWASLMDPWVPHVRRGERLGGPVDGAKHWRWLNIGRNYILLRSDGRRARVGCDVLAIDRAHPVQDSP